MGCALKIHILSECKLYFKLFIGPQKAAAMRPALLMPQRSSLGVEEASGYEWINATPLRGKGNRKGELNPPPQGEAQVKILGQVREAQQRYCTGEL